MDVAQILEKNAKLYSAQPAVIFRDRAISFAQIRDYAFCLANTLIRLGLNKGDRLAIYLPNCPEYIYSYLATWSCAACAVPLDFMLTEDELISCISHSEAKILVAHPKASISFERIRENCPSLKKIILSFEDLWQKLETAGPRVEIKDDDYAIIFYTSGTTGKPKGVLINYRQLEACPQGIKYFVNEDIADKDTALCALPFSHLGGLIYIQANIVYGTRIVLMERFSPLEFLRSIQNHKINFFWIVPSMYYAFLQLKEFETFDLSSLRWLVCFGASSSPDALRRFHQYCPHADLLNGWGLTETNAPTTVLPRGSDKIQSVGRPAPWIEVKLFDDSDKELPAGGVGEIAVKSWVVTDGYYRDTELTKQTIRNGWFYTGDLGRFDSEGYLYIVGRKKEMIKVAGEIVFEPEVEAAIYKHPAVAEVAVIGVPDKIRGELPKAFVTLKEGKAITEDELRQFCREHLAHFKIPHYVEFIASLPKNRTGKIDKELLRNIQ